MSTSPTNAFVVGQLRPTHSTHDGCYQITEASAHPVIVLGKDLRGRDIVETVAPFARTGRFLNLDGIVMTIPLSTAATPTNHDDRCEQQITHDQIRAGWLVLGVCPFDLSYKNVLGFPAVPIPAGEQSCGGRPDGCSHLHEIAEIRKAESRRRYEEDQNALMSMSPGEAASLLRRLGGALDVVTEHAGTEPAAVQNTKAARARLTRSSDD